MAAAGQVGDVWAEIERAEMAELKELRTAYEELQRLPLNRRPTDAMSLRKEEAVNSIVQAIRLVTAAEVLTEKVKRSAVGVFNTLGTAMNQINADLKEAKGHYDRDGNINMLEGLQFTERAANKLKGVILTVWSILALEGQVRK